MRIHCCPTCIVKASSNIFLSSFVFNIDRSSHNHECCSAIYKQPPSPESHDIYQMSVCCCTCATKNKGIQLMYEADLFHIDVTFHSIMNLWNFSQCWSDNLTSLSKLWLHLQSSFKIEDKQYEINIFPWEKHRNIGQILLPPGYMRATANMGATCHDLPAS